jgi:hypothetical protein
VSSYRCTYEWGQPEGMYPATEVLGIQLQGHSGVQGQPEGLCLAHRHHVEKGPCVSAAADPWAGQISGLHKAPC